MRLTKYEHACLVLEEQGKRLVIDPGTFTKSLTDVNNILGIVITHAHQDHFDQSLVDLILDANPGIPIITLQAVADLLPGKTLQVITGGTSTAIGPFELEFNGGEHALIHESIPRASNVGVMVNKLLYYPGDSFTSPDSPVKTLALPIAAPWMKVGEAMDYLGTVRSSLAFPTHNGFLSDAGKSLEDQIVGSFAQSLGVTYRPLTVSEQLELT